MKTIFCHIPKTGGTSIKSVLESFYAPQDICPYYWMDELMGISLDPYDFIGGHVPFQFLNDRFNLNQSNCLSVISIRDPLSRTLSHISHMKRDSTAILNTFVSGKTPAQILKSPIGQSYFSNYLTKFLGKPVKGLNQHSFDLTPACEDDFIRAKDVIESVDFIISDFDDFEGISLYKNTMMCLDFPSKISIPHLNRSPVESQVIDDIDLINQCLFYDIKLYEIAKNKVSGLKKVVNQHKSSRIYRTFGFNPSFGDVNRPFGTVVFMQGSSATLTVRTYKSKFKIIFNLVYAESDMHFQSFRLAVHGKEELPININILQDQSTDFIFIIDLGNNKNSITDLTLLTSYGVTSDNYLWSQTLGFSSIKIIDIE